MWREYFDHFLTPKDYVEAEMRCLGTGGVRSRRTDSLDIKEEEEFKSLC